MESLITRTKHHFGPNATRDRSDFQKDKIPKDVSSYFNRKHRQVSNEEWDNRFNNPNIANSETNGKTQSERYSQYLGQNNTQNRIDNNTTGF